MSCECGQLNYFSECTTQGCIIERYKCPHPDCNEITAVKVSGGEDYCEDLVCSWVESDCSDCFESVGRCVCPDEVAE